MMGLGLGIINMSVVLGEDLGLIVGGSLAGW